MDETNQRARYRLMSARIEMAAGSNAIVEPEGRLTALLHRFNQILRGIEKRETRSSCCVLRSMHWDQSASRSTTRPANW